uniref:Uncharacterized protein n=1 Tax=Oxyrrhis marina TaxID=2969 RepID=A0A7S3XFM2_OXYMA
MKESELLQCGFRPRSHGRWVGAVNASNSVLCAQVKGCRIALRRLGSGTIGVLPQCPVACNSSHCHRHCRIPRWGHIGEDGPRALRVTSCSMVARAAAIFHEKKKKNSL